MENLEPPKGGDNNQSVRYMAAIIALTVVSVLIVWLRMYVRGFVSRNLGWDDWTMFAASIIAVITNAFLVLSYQYGVGRHIYYVAVETPHNIPEAFKWLWAGEPTNLFAVYLARLSICLFFLRLVPPKKRYTWVIWITIALLTVSAIFTSIYYFFECRPIQKVWEPETTKGKCFSTYVQMWATWLYQATSILGDLVLLCIPITLFWRLQVRLRTKIGLIIICSLGIFTNVCAIVKTILLPNLFSSNPDKTWIVKDLALWAPMELCIGMICGTIPALAPLFGLSSNKSSAGAGKDGGHSYSSSGPGSRLKRQYRRFGGKDGHSGGSYELNSVGSRRPRSGIFRGSQNHPNTLETGAGFTFGADNLGEKPALGAGGTGAIITSARRPSSEEHILSPTPPTNAADLEKALPSQSYEGQYPIMPKPAARSRWGGIRTTKEVEVSSEANEEYNPESPTHTPITANFTYPDRFPGSASPHSRTLSGKSKSEGRSDGWGGNFGGAVRDALPAFETVGGANPDGGQRAHRWNVV